MKTIKMVVLAILAMVFSAIAFPAMAADQQVKRVQKPQMNKIRKSTEQQAPITEQVPWINKLARECGEGSRVKCPPPRKVKSFF